MVALVETQIPIRCRWCDRRNHVFLEVSPPPEKMRAEAYLRLVLCPECDKHALPLVRRRVIYFGRLVSRGEDLIWVSSPRTATS